MDAETAYLFRHSILRDAAYQLQLPAQRSKLHALALEIIDHLPMDKNQRAALAGELATHARAAQVGAKPKAKARFQRLELGLLRPAISHANANWRHEEAIALARRLRELPCASPRDHSVAQNFVVSSLMFLGRMEAARAEVTEGIRVSREFNDHDGERIMLYNASVIARELGDMDELDRRSLELLAAERDSTGTAHYARALKARASALVQQGKYEESVELCTQALVVFEQRGDAREIAGILMDRCNSYERLKRLEEAQRDFLRAREICVETQDYFRLANLLMNEARSLLVRQKVLKADRLAREALQAVENANSHNLHAQVLCVLARARQASGDSLGAENLLRRASEMASTNTPANTRAGVFAVLAEQLLNCGKREEAQAAFEVAENCADPKLVDSATRDLLQTLASRLA